MQQLSLQFIPAKMSSVKVWPYVVGRHTGNPQIRGQLRWREVIEFLSPRCFILMHWETFEFKCKTPP